MTNVPQPPPQSRGRGRGLALGVTGAAVLVALAVIGYLVIRGDDASVGGAPQVSGSRSTPTAGDSSSRGASSSSTGTAATSGAPTTGDAGDRWQGQTGAYGTYLVPPQNDGWTLAPKGESMGYADETGKTLAKAQTPAYLRAGYCTSGSAVARAWVGLSPTPDGVVESSKAVATGWAGVIGRHQDGKQDPRSPVISRQLPSDVPGLSLTSSRTVLTLTQRDQAGCLPPRLEVSTVTARASGHATTLVLVRDLDVADQLPEDIKDRILSSVRPSSA